MKSYVLFNTLTGKARVKLQLPNSEDVKLHLEDGESYLETLFNPVTQQIDVSGPEPIVVDAPPPPPPTVEELADTAEREKLYKHVLLTATPNQINTWVDNNVVADASVKKVIKLLFKLTILGVRR